MTGWRTPLALLVLLAFPGAVGAQTYTLDAEVQTESSARLTLSGHSGWWHLKRVVPHGACTAVKNGNSVDLTGLEPGENYTFHAFNGWSCAPENRLGTAEAVFRTYNFRFVSKTNTTATLKLEHYPAAEKWWYKFTYPYVGGTCTEVSAGTTTVTATDLTKNTSYAFNAYSASGCASADDIGVVHMKTTPVNALYADDVKQTTATLRLTDPPGDLDWWYKRTAGPGAPSTCISAGAAGTSTVSLTGLSGNGDYTYRAYRSSLCAGKNDEIDWISFTTPDLTASGVGPAYVTLTVANHTGKWWHQKTAPSTPAGSCVAVAAGTSTAALNDLLGSTTYSWEAYSAADCASGKKFASETFTTTVAVAPPKPANPGLKVTAGEGSVTLKASLPHHGGSPITKWKYIKKEGDNAWETIWQEISGTSRTLSHTVSSLTNGTAYKFKVRAVNAIGDGAESAESGAVTPSTTPATPTGLTVSGGNGSVTLSWTAGSNGGSAVTGWKYTKKTGDDWDDDWTAVPNSGANTTSYTVPDLTNGTAYKFKVRAVNANGDGAESAESDAVTPSVKPATPTGLTVSGGDGSVALAWTAGSNGGSAITGWKYTKKTGDDWDDDWTAVPNSGAGTTSYTVPDLTNGTAYRFKVRAVNANGDGAESAESASVTPSAKPAAPTGLTVSGGDGSVALSWTAGSNGGSAVTGWKYTKKTGDDWDDDWTAVPNSGAGTTSYTVPDLANGTAYKFKVRAVNANGDGAESAESASVTPATAPPAPSKPSVVAGNKSVTLSGSSVAGTGGSAITKWQYAYKSKPGGGNYGSWGDWQDITGTSTTMPGKTVSGLANGTEYRFRVRAVNAEGDGADSPESDAVTPSAKPAAPTGLTATAGNGTVTLSWTAGSNGGSAITGWKYTKKADGSWDDDWTAVPNSGANTTSYTVPDLTNGTAYTFKVRAVNANGDGAESAESASVTPATAPPAPSKPSVVAGNKSVTLSGASVAGTGGSAITKWQYAYKSKPSSGNYGSWGDWQDITGTSTTMPGKTVSGLTNGTEYRFRVRAVNAEGDGADSPESDAVTPTPAPVLSITDRTATGATLNLANHNAAWYYKADKEPDSSCKGPVSNGTWTRAVTDLSPTKSYIYTVYGDGSCSNTLAAAPAFTTMPDAPSKPGVAASNKSITLSGASVGSGTTVTKWQYAYKSKPSGGNYGNWGDWQDITGTSTTMPGKTVSGLTNGTAYKFRVRAVNGTDSSADSPESDAVTPTAPPPAPSKPSIVAGNKSVTLNGASVAGTGGSAITKWQYAYKSKPSGGNYGNWGDWQDITGTSATMPNTTVSGLTNGTAYMFKVRAVNAIGDGADSPESDVVTPAAESLRVSGVSSTGATLTLSGHTGDWSYKNDGPGAPCHDIASGTTASLSGLTPQTTYRYHAYRGSGCSGSPIAAVSFETLESGAPGGQPTGPDSASVTLAASAVTETTATLTLSGHTGDWWYRGSQQGAPCTAVDADTATVDLSGLTGGMSYVYKAYRDKGCATELTAADTDAEFSTVGLAAGSVTATGATLTIANWTAAWWYEGGQSGAPCTAVAANTASAALRDLTAGTRYTYAVYSAAGCGSADRIADVDFETLAGSATVLDGARDTVRRVLNRTLAAVGTRTLTSALGNIGTRFIDGAPGTSLTLAGQAMPFGAAAPRAASIAAGYCAAGRPVRHDFGPTGSGPVEPGCHAAESRPIGASELFRTSAFSVRLGAADGAPAGPLWSLWGRGDTGSFEGRPEAGARYSGEIHTGWLGFDGRAGPWVAGVAVSRGESETEYGLDAGGGPARGRLETALTAVYPYGRWTLDNGLELRGVVGAGSGEARHRPEGRAAETSDVSMRMASAGVRRSLPALAGLDLALRADASVVQLEVGDGPAFISGVSADSWRVRAGLEASRRFALADGAALEPFAEAAGRRDGGDGLTGTGLEVAGGVRYTAPRLQVEARGRWLAAHSGEGARERGVSVTARVGPGADGRGLSLSLSPRWGADTGSATALWQDDLPHRLGDAAAAGAVDAGGFDARVDYGLVRGSGSLLTPFAELGLTDGASHRLRLGTRFEAGRADLGLELAGERHESDGAPPDNGVRLDLRLRF